jgi:hypothetical protein
MKNLLGALGTVVVLLGCSGGAGGADAGMSPQCSAYCAYRMACNDLASGLQACLDVCNSRSAACQMAQATTAACAQPLNACTTEQRVAMCDAQVTAELAACQ